MGGHDPVGDAVRLLIAALLLIVAYVLTFRPKAVPGQRVLALYVALLGFQNLEFLPLLLGHTPGSPIAWIAFYARVDVTYAAHLVLAGFLWLYPKRAKLRSVDGAIQLAGSAYLVVATLVWLFARTALNEPPYHAGGWGGPRNIVGHFFSFHHGGVVVVQGTMLVSAFLRGRDLPAPARRASALVLAVLVSWAIWWPSSIYVSLAQWTIGLGPSPFPGPGAIPGDVFPVGAVLVVLAHVVLPATFAIVWWRRERSLLPTFLVGLGILQYFLVTAGSSDYWFLQHLLTAIVLGHVVARQEAFSAPGERAWPTQAVAAIAGLLVLVSANMVVLSISSAPLFVSFGILAGLAAGAATAYALLSRSESLALGFGTATPDDTERRLAPYRVALADAIGRGLSPDESSKSLRALRTTLGVSEREHAALAYALRAGTPGGGTLHHLPKGSLFLGRYRVERVLGEGGAGTTYLCRDESVGREVVLKTLRARGSSPEHLAAVLREARAIAAVRHPHVATLYDVEQVGDDGVLVMEYVEGGSLRDRLARGALDRASFLRVARDLLDALGAVHAANVVHRDVKPSNVLLTAGGGAKLADFGVAHVPGFETTAGTVPADRAVGTARYMSPEQARGRRATARSDLYSAAATLYEAWTGRPLLEPRPGESAVEVQMRAATAGAFTKEMDAPEALKAWFARALDPAPSERFASARDMRDALEAALGGS